MNRREMIRALVALPAVESIAVARLQPRDVVVVECSLRLTVKQRDQLRENLRQYFPNNRVAILDSSMRLRVLKASEVEP